MDEREALRRICRGDEDALGAIIRRYAAYVNTVVRNIIGTYMSPEDCEEVSSDCFCTLWEHAGGIDPARLKPWLGSVARNAAKNKLRELGRELPLEEDEIDLISPSPEDETWEKEKRTLVRSAVLDMEWPEREIFLRHYYYCQNVERVAEEMGMNLSTVKTRLRRGRMKLKVKLFEGGLLSEDDDIRASRVHTG